MKNRQKQPGLVEGPLGFPMREESAREIDELLKAQPSGEEYEYRHLSVAADDVRTDEDARTDTSFITTDALDRDREVVLPGGGDFAQFRKNPVVTFAHRYNELPVGRALWLKRDEQNGRAGILAKTQYAAKPDDWGDAPWQPSAVWAWVQQGILKGKSIGFLPTQVRPPTEKDLKARPDWANVGLIISKWLMLEYAVAPVPSNPDALVQSIGKGLVVPESMLEAMGMMVPDAQNGFTVMPHDGQNGFTVMPQDGQNGFTVMPQDGQSGFTTEVLPAKVAFVTEAQYRKAIAARNPVAALRGIDVDAAVRDELDRRRGRV